MHRRECGVRPVFPLMLYGAEVRDVKRVKYITTWMQSIRHDDTVYTRCVDVQNGIVDYVFGPPSSLLVLASLTSSGVLDERDGLEMWS